MNELVHTNFRRRPALAGRRMRVIGQLMMVLPSNDGAIS